MFQSWSLLYFCHFLVQYYDFHTHTPLFFGGESGNSPKILLINVLLFMLLSISFYLHGHFRDKIGMFTSVIFCKIAIYPKYFSFKITVFFPLDIYSLKIISFKNKVGKKWELCISILFACSHKIKLTCLSSGCITSQVGHVFVFSSNITKNNFYWLFL